MRTFDSTTAQSYLIADIDVARWEQYGLADTLPFNAMWYTVPPGSVTPMDCHPEPELSVVVSGSAAVVVEDKAAYWMPAEDSLEESESRIEVTVHA